MQTAAYTFYVVGCAFLLLAIAQSTIQAFRRQDRARLDALLFLTLLGVSALAPGPENPMVAVRMAAGRLAPWALLPLVAQFRRVPGWMGWGAVIAAVVGPALVGLRPYEASPAVRVANSLYLAGSAAALGFVFGVEGLRSSGTKSRRLGFAAAGTGLISAAAFFNAFAPSSPDIGRVVAIVQWLLRGIAFICFYFAFTTPRFLLSHWRRAEQSAYLRQAMNRDPEERGRRAGDDLFQAAVRGIGGAVTFVAIRDSPAEPGYRIVNASEPALAGRLLTPRTGLFAESLTTGRAVAGPPAACEHDLEPGALTHGGAVLVAPIVAAQPWGLVVVAQRRGALFPEDDLEMLAQIARNAGVALDHRQLILERREHERRDAERRLREIESRVDLMIESIKDYAMLVLDADGRIAAWHLGAEHVFGHARAAVTGESAARIYDLSPEAFAAWLRDARLRGRAEREGTCRRADGSTFIGITMIRPLASEPGRAPGFVAVTHDVTERRELEERLRQGQKMEAIGQLAGGVAHDFNNLLTAILGYSDWLDRDLAGDPRRDQVTEIQKAAERAADLTRQLLAFSRRQVLRPIAVDLAELTRDLVPMLRRIIGEQIEIVEESADNLPAVMADRSQLEQIILNLAVNARDAMPNGGRLTIRVDEAWLDEDPATTSQLPPGPYALLEVADTGSGMDAETARRAFEPFFTTKEVGRGTGLGLSTVYGIVQQMNGAIDFRTAIGEGTTFRLYFPQVAERAHAEPVETGAHAPSRGHETVLLVEDDAAVRSYLTHVLAAEGYRVRAAEHAGAALAIQQAGERIDLVISDVVMPGGTGPELVQLLGRAQPHVPALFISGHEAGVLARHATAVNGTPLLLKPFSSKELLSKVRQILSAA